MTITESTVLVPCTEPACSKFGIGHLETRTHFPEDMEPIHEASVTGEKPLWITVQKLADEPWEVEFEGDHNFPATDPDTAERIAAAIVAAAAKCRELNAA